MLELDKIHCGDNCDLLGQLPRECIDLVVTSPPLGFSPRLRVFAAPFLSPSEI